MDPWFCTEVVVWSKTQYKADVWHLQSWQVQTQFQEVHDGYTWALREAGVPDVMWSVTLRQFAERAFHYIWKYTEDPQRDWGKSERAGRHLSPTVRKYKHPFRTETRAREKRHAVSRMRWPNRQADRLIKHLELIIKNIQAWLFVYKALFCPFDFWCWIKSVSNKIIGPNYIQKQASHLHTDDMGNCQGLLNAAISTAFWAPVSVPLHFIKKCQPQPEGYRSVY